MVNVLIGGVQIGHCTSILRSYGHHIHVVRAETVTAHSIMRTGEETRVGFVVRSSVSLFSSSVLEERREVAGALASDGVFGRIVHGEHRKVASPTAWSTRRGAVEGQARSSLSNSAGAGFGGGSGGAAPARCGGGSTRGQALSEGTNSKLRASAGGGADSTVEANRLAAGVQSRRAHGGTRAHPSGAGGQPSGAPSTTVPAANIPSDERIWKEGDRWATMTVEYYWEDGDGWATATPSRVSP